MSLKTGEALFHTSDKAIGGITTNAVECKQLAQKWRLKHCTHFQKWPAATLNVHTPTILLSSMFLRLRSCNVQTTHA